MEKIIANHDVGVFDQMSNNAKRAKIYNQIGKAINCKSFLSMFFKYFNHVLYYKQNKINLI